MRPAPDERRILRLRVPPALASVRGQHVLIKRPVEM